VGCRVLQGFPQSRRVSADALAALLERGAKKAN
jgi:hypothetical protein